MFPRYRTLGFIFKKTDVGEADRIFSVFTEDFGRIEILGKGIRKIASKLKFSMEIFSLSEIEFLQGRRQKILVGAQIKEEFPKIKRNLKKLAIAYKISEILDFLLKGQEKEERIFQLIKKIFSRLNFSKKEEIIYFAFFWKLISILGYSPQIDRCLICQRKIRKDAFFDFSLGGTVCQKCSKNVKIGEKISYFLLKLLKLSLEKKIEFLERLKLKKEILKEGLNLCSKYFSFLKENNENF